MPRHDLIFKVLLCSFFTDLLWLVVPDLAGRLDLAHPVFLDKEFFTVGGRRRELDSSPGCPFWGDGGHAFPHPRRSGGPRHAGMGRRLWRYHNQIPGLPRQRPSCRSCLYMERGRAGSRSRGWTDDPFGPDLERLPHSSPSPGRLRGRGLLARPEPLAWPWPR